MSMKKLLYLVLGIAVLQSCSREDLMTYEEGSGIYFDNAGILLDTIDVPWGLKNTDQVEQTLRLQVKLVGQVKDYDRKFRIKIQTTGKDSLRATEGVDYRSFASEYILAKGKASATIAIDLLRDAVLLTENRLLTVALEESDEFGFLYTRKLPNKDGTTRPLDTQRVIRLTENFPTPRWWPVYGADYFGKWSVKKSILICDLMDIDRERWVGQLYADPDFTEGLLRFSGVFVHRWLKEQNPAVLDEDGKPMEMGPLSKR